MKPTRKTWTFRNSAALLTILCLLAVATAVTADVVELKVMSYNIWVGGQPLNKTEEVILASGADIIGLQERGGNGPTIAADLGFFYHEVGGSTAILSRYPITQTFGYGVAVTLPTGTEAFVFDVHLAAYPYQPYDLRDGLISTEAQAIAGAESARGGQLHNALAALAPYVASGAPVFFTGDFNEPSHLDWTQEAANAGLHPLSVQWPTSSDVVGAGMADSYREIYPDPVATPGYTWTPLDQAGEVHDRIDYVYFSGTGVTVTDSQIVGEDPSMADIVVSNYPSDHRAVVSTFNVDDFNGGEPEFSFGANLIVNPGAEANAPGVTSGQDLGLFGWTDTSEFITAQQYNGFSADDPSTGGSHPGAEFGDVYFYGGVVGDGASTYQISQRIDVSDGSEDIDAEMADFELSGHFGGWSNQSDNARLIATFLDQTDFYLDSVTIGGYDAFDRRDISQLLFDELGGNVPAGTRTIELVLELDKPEGGAHGDGAADNLSLILRSWDKLTWDATAGFWSDPKWLDTAGQSTNRTPNVDLAAELDGGALTVATDSAALAMTVERGQLAIANDTQLTVGTTMDIGPAGDVTLGSRAVLDVGGTLNARPGSSLELGNDAQLITGGGSVDVLTLDGHATVGVVGGALAVSTITNGSPATLTKRGLGALQINVHNLADMTTRVDLDGGTLRLESSITHEVPIGLTESAWLLTSLGFDTTADPTVDPTIEPALNALLGISDPPGSIAADPGLRWMVDNFMSDTVNFSIDRPLRYEDHVLPMFTTIPSPPDHDYYTVLWHGMVSISEQLADSPFTFGTRSDDGSSLWVKVGDAWQMVVDNRGLHGEEIQTGEVDLPAGNHEIAIAMFEWGGADLIEARMGIGAGLSWDIMGTIDPGNSQLISYVPFDSPTLNLKVVSDSTLEVVFPEDVELPTITLAGGVLATENPMGHKITFEGVLIDTEATRVGMDPRVATDYGRIMNDSTAQKLTIVKAGPSVWNLTEAPGGMTGTKNVTWEVDAGTLQVNGEAPLGGRPVILSGGTLAVMKLLDGPGSGPTPTEGAVSHWSLDDGPGSPIAADSLGPNQGTLVNMDTAADWVAGRSGEAADYALKFDGTPGKVVSAGMAPSLQMVGSLSISAWVNVDNFTDWAAIAGWIHDSGSVESGYALGLYGQGLYWGVAPNASGVINYMYPDGLETDTWYHLVATYDADSGSQRLYVDGNLAGESQLVGGPIDWNPLSQDGFEIGRYHDDNEEYNISGTIDDVRVFSRALDPAEIATWYGLDTPNMVGVQLSVTEDSSLRVQSPGIARFGTLDLRQGILTVEGNSPGIQFEGTTITAEGASTTVGVDLQSPANLGPLTGNGETAVFVKMGPYDLVLDGQGTTGVDAVTFQVQEGTLVALHDGNPLGTGKLTLDGGNLVLAAKADAGDSVLYDNQLTMAENGLLTAGSGGVDGAAVGPVAVTLGSEGRGVSLGDQTLTLRSLDGYRLNIAGPIDGTGEVHITLGDITLSGGGSIGMLRTAGGSLTIAADLHVETLSVTGGTVDTGNSRIVVARQAILGDTPLTIEEGYTFGLSGTDLGRLPGDGEQVDRRITLSGGTFQLGTSSVPMGGLVSYWSLDDGPESTTAADPVGGNDGTLVNLDAATAWVAGHSGDAEDYALRFDGTFDQHVSIGGRPALQVAGDITVSAWVNVDSFTDWPAIAGWVYDTGSTESGYVMGLFANGGFYWGVGPEASGVINYQEVGPYETGTWYHLVGTYDATTGSQRLYVNGQQAAETPLASGPIDWEPLSAEDGFELGRYHDDNDNIPYLGTIDDVLVYERALDAQEVAALYALSPEGKTIDLPTTNLSITADTTLALSSPSQAVLGDLELDDAVTLTIPAAIPSFEDVTMGDGAKIVGSMAVRGTLAARSWATGAAEVQAAQWAIEGIVRMESGSTIAATVGASAND